MYVYPILPGDDVVRVLKPRASSLDDTGVYQTDFRIFGLLFTMYYVVQHHTLPPAPRGRKRSASDSEFEQPVEVHDLLTCRAPSALSMYPEFELE